MPPVRRLPGGQDFVDLSRIGADGGQASRVDHGPCSVQSAAGRKGLLPAIRPLDPVAATEAVISPAGAGHPGRRGLSRACRRNIQVSCQDCACWFQHCRGRTWQAPPTHRKHANPARPPKGGRAGGAFFVIRTDVLRCQASRARQPLRKESAPRPHRAFRLPPSRPESPPNQPTQPAAARQKPRPC